MSFKVGDTVRLLQVPIDVYVEDRDGHEVGAVGKVIYVSNTADWIEVVIGDTTWGYYPYQLAYPFMSQTEIVNEYAID